MLTKSYLMIDTQLFSSYDKGTLVEIFLPDLTAQGGIYQRLARFYKQKSKPYA